MTHDPLCVCADGPCCPWVAGGCDCQCMCDLITKARADEREKAVEKVGRASSHDRLNCYCNTCDLISAICLSIKY